MNDVAPMACCQIDPRQAVRDAVKKVTSIATLPDVTARIIQTVEDPRSTAAQLHHIVRHDPALVTRILKVVNSAFYGLPGQVASIERAIVLLGLNAVKNIAVAAGIGQLFTRAQLCDGFTARDLWTHCIAVAVISRALTSELKLPIVEEAFLAGLIHDVGLIVSLQNDPALLREICQSALRSEQDFLTIERDLSGMDHQLLGAELAEQWKFPRSCQMVAAHHHTPLTAPDSQQRLVGIVHLADTLCCQMQHGFTLTARHQPVDATILQSVGASAATLERIQATLPAQVELAVQMLA